MNRNYQKKNTKKNTTNGKTEKNNKIQNTYHQFSKCLVNKYDIIAMETLNIKGMFQNKKWSTKLQKIGPYNTNTND